MTAKSTPNHICPESAAKEKHIQAAPSIDASSTVQSFAFAHLQALRPWFPRIDPDHKQAKTLGVRLAKRESLLLTAAITTTAIFVVNLIVTCVLYFLPRYHQLYSAGTIVFYHGGCEQVRVINVSLHGLINLLASVLYLFSQLCMQLVTAPTRDQVDQKHQRGDWYDIGILSVRNFLRSKPGSQVLLLVLLVSSLPLHFVYNSVVSTTNVSSFEYPAVVAAENFLHGAPWGTSFLTNAPDKDSGDESPVNGHLGKLDTQTLQNMIRNSRDKNVFTNLTNFDCLWRYSDLFGQHSNLIIIVDNVSDSSQSSLIEYHYTASGLKNPRAKSDQREWICANDTVGIAPDCTHREDFMSTAPDWDKYGHSVLYCLSQRVEASTGYGQCQMKFSPPLALVVCICIFLKAICMWGVYLSKELRHGVTLCTLGDAIASFLEREDQCTKNLINVTSKELYRQKGKSWEDLEPQDWRRSTKTVARWAETTGKTRLYSTFSLWGLVTIFFLVQFIVQLIRVRDDGTYTTFADIMGLGWGRVDASSIYDLRKLSSNDTASFIGNVFLANYPQFLISVLNTVTISLLACFHVSQEWSSYCQKRKLLRVTHPEGMQRSKYSVSMPLRYGLPFTVAFFALHWLASQSQFIVQSLTYGGTDGTPRAWQPNLDGFVTTGYSVAATFTAFVITLALFLAILGLSYLHKTQSGMPLACTCSAAISAACHPPSADNEAYLFPIQWGVIPSDLFSEPTSRQDDYCAFTTLYPLDPPAGIHFLEGEAPVAERLRKMLHRNRGLDSEPKGASEDASTEHRRSPSTENHQALLTVHGTTPSGEEPSTAAGLETSPVTSMDRPPKDPPAARSQSSSRSCVEHGHRVSSSRGSAELSSEPQSATDPPESTSKPPAGSC